MEERTFFQIITSIVDKKFFPTEDEIGTLNSYITLQYLANDPQASMYANVINCYSDIPLSAQYRFLRHSLPKKFIKFNKKEKIQDKETVELVSRYYNISEKLAINYLELLNTNDIDEIKDYFNCGRIK